MAILQRLVAGVLALVFVVSALIFASLLLGVLLAVALAVGGWWWWRTRSARLRQGAPAKGGVVIEGEFRHEPQERLEEPERR